VTATAAKAPLLGRDGGAEVSLDADVFGAEVKPHLLHETVRAELNAARAGTRGGKSRGLVAGGRAKPWRQKGTGRARAGTTRAPQWTGGGLAFPPGMRSFELKVNRKARRAAFRGALAQHASRGTVALVADDAIDEPSTKAASALLDGWGQERPTLVVAIEEQETLVKSFRNLDRVLVTAPEELEVAALLWARSLLVTEAALPVVLKRAGANGEEASE
jgi:large subunit ribosomal protein L4